MARAKYPKTVSGQQIKPPDYAIGEDLRSNLLTVREVQSHPKQQELFCHIEVHVGTYLFKKEYVRTGPDLQKRDQFKKAVEKVLSFLDPDDIDPGIKGFFAAPFPDAPAEPAPEDLLEQAAQWSFCTAQACEAFRLQLLSILDKASRAAKKGRRPDILLDQLAMAIAMVLDSHGIKVTTTATGPFVVVLGYILDDIREKREDPRALAKIGIKAWKEIKPSYEAEN